MVRAFAGSLNFVCFVVITPDPPRRCKVKMREPSWLTCPVDWTLEALISSAGMVGFL